MNLENHFKLGIFFALLWHIAVASSISFTFVRPQVHADKIKIVFLGPILTNADFYSTNKAKDNSLRPDIDLDIATKNSSKFPYFLSLKPKAAISSLPEKSTLFNGSNLVTPSAILTKGDLYRPAVSGSLAYSKDTPASTIELKYSVAEDGRPITIQRLLSSGNLEVDLLAINYLKHWIFLTSPEINYSSKIKLNLSEFR